MSDTSDDSSIRYYFSFRSPYSWLATERLDLEVGGAFVSADPAGGRISCHSGERRMRQ